MIDRILTWLGSRERADWALGIAGTVTLIVVLHVVGALPWLGRMIEGVLS
jgi:hypothetical protein